MAHLAPAAYVGRAPEQVERFIKETVDPLLAGREMLSGMNPEV